MVAAAGFDTRSLQVLSNQCPGGPLPDKGVELDKGIAPPVASAWATLRKFFMNSGQAIGCPRLNRDPPRDADRRLSKVGDVARRTQASPTREHVGGLFGPDCKGNELVDCLGMFVQEPRAFGSK